MPDYSGSTATATTGDPFAQPDLGAFASIATGLSDQDVATRVMLARRTYPDLGSDPAALLVAARQPTSDQQMLDSLGKAYHLSDVAGSVKDLGGQPDNVQSVVWNNLPTEMQQKYRALGYVPPSERPQSGSGGWTLGIAGHDLFTIGDKGTSPVAPLTNAIGGALSGGADAIAAVGGPAADLAGAPLRNLQHLYRAAENIGEGPQGNRSWMDGLAQSFNPSAWADAWNVTGDGMHYFTHDSVAAATDGLKGDNRKLILAKEMAAGADFKTVIDRTLSQWGLDQSSDPQAWLQGVGELEKAMGDPAVQAAVTDLSNGHVTFGRQVARQMGLHDFTNPTGAGSLVSGAVDLVAALKADPVLKLGEGLHGVKAFRWGVRGATDGEQLADLGKLVDQAKLIDSVVERPSGLQKVLPGYNDVNRATGLRDHAQQVAAFYQAPDEAMKGMLDANRGLVPVLGPFDRWLGTSGIRREAVTADTVLDYYHSQVGMGSLLQDGKGFEAIPLVPHVTGTQRALIQAKSWFHDSVDLLAEAGDTYRDAKLNSLMGLDGSITDAGSFKTSFLDGLADPKQLFLDGVSAPFGKLIRGFITYAPRGGKVLQLSGEGTLEELRRFADMTLLTGGTSADADQLFARLIRPAGAAPSLTGTLDLEGRALTGERQAVVLGGIQDMLIRSDLMDTPFRDRFMTRLGQAYGVTGGDEVTFDASGSPLVTGLVPGDVATAMRIPAAWELLQASRAQSLTKFAFGNYNRIADPFMTGIWKPLTLMRMAFIPRVAGEELLRGMVHLGPYRLASNLFANYALGLRPVREAVLDESGQQIGAGDPLRTLDGRIAMWQPVPTRSSAATGPESWVDAFGRPASEQPPLADSFTKAFVPDPQPYESMWLRPVTALTGSLDRWASASHAEGLLAPERAALGKLTHGLDGLATRIAMGAAVPTGALADLAGLPTRRELVARFVNPDSLRHIRLALDDPQFADALSHNFATSLMRSDELGGSKSVQQLRAQRPNSDGGWDYKNVILDRSVRELQPLEDFNGHVALAATMRRLQDSPAGWGMGDAFAHYLGPDQLDQLTRLGGDLGLGTQALHAGDETVLTQAGPLTTVRQLRAKVGPELKDDRVRAAVADLLSGRDTNPLAVLDAHSPLLAEIARHPLVHADRDLLGWLAHEYLSPAAITDDSTVAMERAVKNAMSAFGTAEGQASLEGMGATIQDPVTGRPIAQPFRHGETALHYPMTTEQGAIKLAQTLSDDHRFLDFTTRLENELRGLRGVSADEAQAMVEGLARPDPAALSQTRSGLAATTRGGRFVPVSLHASPDYQVVDTINQAIARATGEDTAVGQVVALKGELANRRMMTAVRGDPATARAFALTPQFATMAEPLEPSATTTLYHLPSGEWVTRDRVPTSGAGPMTPTTGPSFDNFEMSVHNFEMTPGELDGPANTISARAIDPDADGVHNTLFVHHGPEGKPDAYLLVRHEPGATTPLDLTVHVDEAMRRQGIGSALYAAAEKEGFNVEGASGNNGLSELGAAFQRGRRAKLSALDPDSLPTQTVGGIPRQQAIENLSRRLAANYLAGISNYDREKEVPEVAHSVLQSLMSKEVLDEGGVRPRFDADAYLGVSPQHLPEKVMAPVPVLADDMHPFKSFTRWFFDGPFNSGMRAISRMPLALEAYGRRYDAAHGVLNELFHPPEQVAAATPAFAKLGYDLTDPTAARRFGLEADRLSPTILDPKASTADINKALNNALTGPGEDALPELDRGEITALRKYVKADKALHAQLAEQATRGMIKDVAPFVHDPELRSHFQNTVGTAVPFWFAQDQFLRRWAKTLADSPEALRKLSLLHNGIRDVGFTQTDPNTGEETFVLPGTEQTTAALAAGLSFVTGGHLDFRLPIYAAMTGTAQFVVPGFTDTGLPSLGPVAGFTLKAMEHLFPELGDLEGPILGSRQRPDWLDLLVPAPYRNIMRGMRGDMSDDRYAQEFANQIIYEAAHGQFPHEGPQYDAQGNMINTGAVGPGAADLNKLHMEDVLARIREGTRGTLIYKGLLGLLAPISGGTPQAAYLDGMNAEIKALFAEGLDAGEVYNAFRARHVQSGDPLRADAVFAGYELQPTERPSKAPLPTTQAAYDWAQQHADVIQAYKYGAPWLLPTETQGDAHSRQAYNQQLTLQMRTLRSPDELVSQLYFQEGAELYFKAEDEKKAILNGPPTQDPQAMLTIAPWLAANPEFAQGVRSGNIRKGVEDAWKIWSQGYQAAHPIFADQLRSSSGQASRLKARTELDTLLRSPEYASDPKGAAIKGLLDQYQSYNDRLGAMSFSNTARAQRNRDKLKAQFAAWADTYVLAHPLVSSFFNGLIRPDL